MGERDTLFGKIKKVFDRKEAPRQITEEDRNWNTFIEGAHYDLNKLIDLATDREIDDIYRLRAIKLLLHPHPGKLDFETGVFGRSSGNECYGWIPLLEEKMLELTLNQLLVYREIDEKEWRAFKPAGFGWQEEKRWERCNQAIMEVAVTLGGVEGENAFKSFSIRNPKGLSDEYRRYQPLRWLINNPDISEDWKELALIKLHKDIKAEEIKKKERETCKQLALDFLTFDVVEEQLKRRRPLLEHATLKREIYYLADRKTEAPLINLELLPSIWRIIDNPVLTSRIVRAATVDCKVAMYQFGVTHDGSRRLARDIMTRMKDDKEVVAYFREKIANYDEERRESEEEKRRAADEKQDILNKMRRK